MPPERGANRSWLVPFGLAGIACVAAGGLLAAGTAYASTRQTAWATAYLVLVGGLAQVALGAAMAHLAPVAGRHQAWATFAGWNLGNAGVLVGQLTGSTTVTDIGGALLVLTLAAMLWSTHGARPGDRASSPGRPSVRRWILLAFRILLALLLISIPVGLILAHLGSGSA